MSTAHREIPSGKVPAHAPGEPATSQGWSVEAFDAFWAKPTASPDRVPALLAPDMVGYWPAREQPVRGARAYWRYIVDLLALVPDFRARILEHASSGEFTFMRWEATGTGPDGPFATTGCDRIHVRDGIVLENRIYCEHPIFRMLAARATAPVHP